MNIDISESHKELGQKTASLAKLRLKEALDTKGQARVLLATGMSQMETMQQLVREDIDWSNVEVFHMDEYIGLPPGHKASFVKYIQERFISKVNVKMFYPVKTDGDLTENINKLTLAIREKPIDVAIIGIGENTHIGFNDPPADFATQEAFIKVTLDEKCKMQQVREGWFDAIADVPDEAVTITPYQVMQCKTIICGVPFEVKAEAVYKTFNSKITGDVPSSILKSHDDFYLFLDKASASKVIQF